MAFLDENGLSYYHGKIDNIFAHKDGSYSTLTAGNAEQLVSTVGVEDSTPYLFRTTGGSADVGDRVKLKEVVGGTVAWNQLAKFDSGSIPSASHGITYSYTDGTSVKITGTADGNESRTGWFGLADTALASKAGHKCLFASNLISGTVTGTIVFNLTGTASIYLGSAGIKKITSSGIQYRLSHTIASGTVCTDAYVTLICVDLTAMFGSTIADYLYTLESGTAGAGVAKLKSWGFCTKDYYAYDAGSLLSVKTSAHKTIGFNAYNPDTGKAVVLAGHEYEVVGTYTALTLDGSTITPSGGKFTPSITGELTVTGGDSTTCIHLVWDGERDGEYEPYVEYSYPLDDVELRGIPKLDANNNLYYDGDSYPPDGTVTRRFAIVNLGEKTWTRNAVSGGAHRFQTTLSDMKTGSASKKGNLICAKYPTVTANDTYNGIFGISDNGTDTKVCIVDDNYSDKDTFKTAMNGVYLVYELATATTESADPYQESQICSDWGSEEFVDSRTVPMPVGYSALYQANLRAKLEMAPDSPSGDGDYIVRQTDGLNGYVLLEKELPTAPAEDGTYSLKCTVSSGTATLSWVADE